MLPLSIKVSLIGMWIPIVNLLPFDIKIKAILQLILLGIQFSLIRKPWIEMNKRLKEDIISLKKEELSKR